MQNCVKYKCRNYVNASEIRLQEFTPVTSPFYFTLRTIKTCVKMSNFMRNCVIEMEIADINLSLLSMLLRCVEGDHERAIRAKGKLRIKLR